MSEHKHPRQHKPRTEEEWMFGQERAAAEKKVWAEGLSVMTRQRRRAQARHDAKDVARHPLTLVNVQ